MNEQKKDTLTGQVKARSSTYVEESGFFSAANNDVGLVFYEDEEITTAVSGQTGAKGWVEFLVKNDRGVALAHKRGSLVSLLTRIVNGEVRFFRKIENAEDSQNEQRGFEETHNDSQQIETDN